MNTLTTNLQEIVSLHGEIVRLLQQSLPMAQRIGELLLEQKKALAHGQFTAWVEEFLPFTARTARNYMRVYEHRELLKTENVSDLSDAYRLLSPSTPEKPDQGTLWRAFEDMLDLQHNFSDACKARILAKLEEERPVEFGILKVAEKIKRIGGDGCALKKMGLKLSGDLTPEQYIAIGYELEKLPLYDWKG